MLIVLCLNIYMANNLIIDIRCLLVQSTEHEITLLIVSQIEMKPNIIAFVEPPCDKVRHSCYNFSLVYVRAPVHL